MQTPLVLVDHGSPQSGSYNMALDQHLINYADKLMRPVWRLYRWMPAAVSIGRNQKVADAVNRDVLVEEGIPLVRRPTGGRAIYHIGDICFTHAGITPGESESIRAFKDDYLRAANMLVRCLEALGVDAVISDGQVAGRLPGRSVKAPCFQAAGRYEVMVRGRKIAGIAQFRSAERFLIQGSIRVSEMDSLNRRLYFDDDETGRKAFENLKQSTTSIEQELRRKIEWDELLNGFAKAVGLSEETLLDTGDPRSEIDFREVDLVRTRMFENSAWNERF